MWTGTATCSPSGNPLQSLTCTGKQPGERGERRPDYWCDPSSTSGLLSRPLWDRNLVQQLPARNQLHGLARLSHAHRPRRQLNAGLPLAPRAFTLGLAAGRSSWKAWRFPAWSWVVKCERLRTSEQVRKSVQERSSCRLPQRGGFSLLAFTSGLVPPGWGAIAAFFVPLKGNSTCNLPQCFPRSTLLSQFCFPAPGPLSPYPQLHHQHRSETFLSAS